MGAADKVIGMRDVVVAGETRTVPVIDARGETRVNWKREVDQGHLKRVDGAGNVVDGSHVSAPKHTLVDPSTDVPIDTTKNTPWNGKRVVQGDVITKAQDLNRNRPGWVMDLVRQTEGKFPEGFDKRTNTYRAPQGRVGFTAPAGGWPTFDKDGRIIRDEEQEQ